MKQIQKQWLGSVPWGTVLSINQDQCQAQNTAHQPKPNSFDAARDLWEKSVSKAMSLQEVLDVCRKCYELAPFVFNNGNTFAAVSTRLIQEWADYLPAVEAQILRTTVSHYVAGQVGKSELRQVIRHFESSWTKPAPAKSSRPALEKPRIEPSLS